MNFIIFNLFLLPTLLPSVLSYSFSLPLVSTSFSTFNLRNLADDFVPDNILKIMHNGFRIQGGNKFEFPVNITALDEYSLSNAKDFLTSDEGKYYVGALSGGILMIIFLFIWFVLLATSCCCRRLWPCCNDPCITVLLVFAIAVSTIGWFYSIGGNAELQDGLSATVDATDEVNAHLSLALLAASNIIALNVQVQAQLDTARTDCAQTFAANSGIESNFDNFEASAAEFGNFIDEPKKSMSQASDAVNKSIDAIKPILETISPIYTAFTATIITLLGIFALTTTFRVLSEKNMLNCEENIIAGLNNCINKFGVILLFSLGFAVVVTVWILSAIMSPVATVGSDLCIPDFNTNLLDSVNAVIPGGSSTDFCTEPITSASSDEEKIANMICHFTTCEGNTFIFNDLGIDPNDPGNYQFVNDARTAFTQIRNQIDSQNAADETQCLASFDPVNDQIDELEGFLTDILNALDCAPISEAYLSMVNDEFCNGVISGIALIFITWTTGAAGMMLGMWLFLLLDPKKVYSSGFSTRTIMVIKDKNQGDTATVVSHHQSGVNSVYADEVKLSEGGDVRSVASYNKSLPPPNFTGNPQNQTEKYPQF